MSNLQSCNLMVLETYGTSIHAICKQEADFIKEKQLTVFGTRKVAHSLMWMEQAIKSILTEKVFLTIDLDGRDPTLVPGVETPEPSGLN
jgi:agmatinase